MGLDLCWVGVEAHRRKRLLDSFGLELAGDVSDELSAEFTFAETPEGWIVLVARAQGFDLDEMLASVSSSCGFAVGGQVVEGATFSRAVASRDGHRLWSVAYNDGVPGGLDTWGDVPAAFEAIRMRLTVQEASAPDGVIYLFGAPADLAADVTGYRPGDDSELEWAALRKKRAGTNPAPLRRRSLRSAMFAELVPFVRSLGWESPDRPVLADPGQIRRTADGAEQTLWFEYASGQETYVIVHFFARACAGQPEFEVGGRVTAPRIRLPIWKRFTWKRLSELTRYEPPPDDIVAAVIDRACEEIRIADEYLRNWTPNARILLDYVRPKAE